MQKAVLVPRLSYWHEMLLVWTHCEYHDDQDDHGDHDDHGDGDHDDDSGDGDHDDDGYDDDHGSDYLYEYEPFGRYMHLVWSNFHRRSQCAGDYLIKPF